jgi:hypothetical protein
MSPRFAIRDLVKGSDGLAMALACGGDAPPFKRCKLVDVGYQVVWIVLFDGDGDLIAFIMVGYLNVPIDLISLAVGAARAQLTCASTACSHGWGLKV